MQYNIKGLTTRPSTQWGPKGGYSCTLYKGTQKVATVANKGDGGATNITYVSAQAKLDFVQSCKGVMVDTDYGKFEADAELMVAHLVDIVEGN
jgi:hypothetical protein